jgi:predicted transcriptional regulator
MEKVIEKVNNLLQDAGYISFSFEFQSIREKYCYDLIVKNPKSNFVFIVKAFKNIDNINEEILDGIKTLSKLFKSKPLLIGVKNRYQKLEDNTIYLREELPIITITTLENILRENLFPYILIRRGGGVIYLDGPLVKKLREEKRISRKELSEKIGLTKRTICSYESEKMRPSKETAEKLKAALGADSKIFRNINVFDWHFEFDITQVCSKEKKELSEFEEHIKNVIQDIGISSYWYKKGQFPFEMLISSKNLEETRTGEKNEFYPLFSEISEVEKKIKELSIKYLKNLTKLFSKKALFIVNNDIKVKNIIEKFRIPIIKIRSLEKINNEREFKEYFLHSLHSFSDESDIVN